MNGVEDCGKRQGNGKEEATDPPFINDWLLEGIVDATSTLNCTVP